MDCRTKKQHYIAQCIINIFVENKKIYEKIIDKNKIYNTSVGNSMCHNNSYEYILLPDNTLEKFFASSIDNGSANGLKNILKLIEKEKTEISKVHNEVCNNLYYFITNYYKSMASLIRMGVKDNDIDQASSITQLLFRIFNEKYIMRLISIITLGYKFAVIKSQEGNFIMSDQYIATCSTSFKGQFLNISSRDIGIKDSVILIPFNSHYYGMFYNGKINNIKIDDNKINILDKEAENIINQVIYDNATYKVLGTCREILSDLDKINKVCGDITASAIYSNNKTITYKVKKEVFLDKKEYEFFEYWKTYKWTKMKTLGRNDKCLCGSNLKYKRCCKDKVERCFQIMDTMHYSQKSILIMEELGMEEPILMPISKNKEMKELVTNLKNRNQIKH